MGTNEDGNTGCKSGCAGSAAALFLFCSNTSLSKANCFHSPHINRTLLLPEMKNESNVKLSLV